MRTVVVVTRVGVRMGTLPDVTQVEWWGRLAAEVAAGGIPPDAEWVWLCAPEHFPLVVSLAPDRVHVATQDAAVVDEVDGNQFTVVRCDADDRWHPDALDVDMLSALPAGHAHVWPVGRQIDLTTGIGRTIDYRAHWTPPFLAVTQDGRSRMCDVGGPHTSATDGRTVTQTLDPCWLQLVGGWNTANGPAKFGADDRWPAGQILKEAGLKPQDLAFEGELDRLAGKFGTDKGSAPARGLFPKRYAAVYQRLLPDRDADVRLLELGVQAGASVGMWHAWLRNGKVAGVDVKPCPPTVAGLSRFRHFRGTQTDVALLAEAVGWLGRLDVVVDDCSHRHQDHVASWQALWPQLSSGGWYAVEDLHATPASVDWLEGLEAEFHCDGRLAILHKP